MLVQLLSARWGCSLFFQPFCGLRQAAVRSWDMLGATCRSHGAQKIVDFAWQRWEICRWHMKDDAYVCIYVINVIRSGWTWSHHHFHPRTCTAAVFQVGDSFHFAPGSGTTRWVMPRSQRDLAPCPEGRAGLLSDLFVSYCCSISVHTLQMFLAFWGYTWLVLVSGYGSFLEVPNGTSRSYGLPPPTWGKATLGVLGQIPEGWMINDADANDANLDDDADDDEEEEDFPRYFLQFWTEVCKRVASASKAEHAYKLGDLVCNCLRPWQLMSAFQWFWRFEEVLDVW